MSNLISWLIGLDYNYDIDISRYDDWGDVRWHIRLTIDASGEVDLYGDSFEEILTEAKAILEQE